MYQLIHIPPNECVVVDLREPHPSNGYKVVYRVQRKRSSHWENGAVWVMVDFSIEKAASGSVVAFNPIWQPVAAKTSWKDVRATLAELLQVAESDIIE